MSVNDPALILSKNCKCGDWHAATQEHFKKLESKIVCFSCHKLIQELDSVRKFTHNISNTLEPNCMRKDTYYLCLPCLKEIEEKFKIKEIKDEYNNSYLTKI